MIVLGTGVAIRDGCVLLVASRYPNHAQPIWNLPGGRQQSGELLVETVAREVFEETGLRVEVGALAYVSESYDGAQHFLNIAFHITPSSPQQREGRRAGAPGEHVVDVAWVPLAGVSERVTVAVVRDPLVAYLTGRLDARYAGVHDAGVTIEWPRDSS